MSFPGIRRPLSALAVAVLLVLAGSPQEVEAGTASSFTATKTVSGDFVPGGTIFYSIRLETSPTGMQDNPGDELVDVLPAEVRLTNLSASVTPVGSGNLRYVPETHTVTFNGTYAAGAIVLGLTAVIDEAAAGRTISNQAVFYYDADGDGTNESSRLTDDPGTSAVDDPTTFVVAGSLPFAEVPTLGEAGLAALITSLACAALISMRRRRMRS